MKKYFNKKIRHQKNNAPNVRTNSRIRRWFQNVTNVQEASGSTKYWYFIHMEKKHE